MSAPPTFVNLALFMLAAIAEIGGDDERARQLYEASAAVQIPPRTNSPNETLDARLAFQRGDHRAAYEILGSYVDELIGVGNTSGVGLVGLEFINMMVAVDRLDVAARIAGILDTGGMLDVEGPGFEVLVADALARGDADPGARQTRRAVADEALDARSALLSIRRMLDSLLNT